MMMRTRAKAPRFLLLLLTTPFLFAGCNYYLLNPDRMPELLIHEDFWYIEDGANTDGSNDNLVWGTLDGEPEDYGAADGRLEIYGPKHFIASADEFEPNLSVEVDWSVTNGALGSPPLPVAGLPDFVVVRSELDVRIALKLYVPDGAGGFENTLRITDMAGNDIAEPVTIKAGAATRGRISAEFIRIGGELTVVAACPELGIALQASVQRDMEKSPVMIVVSGIRSDPRCLEELFVFSRPPDLEALL